jgi:hypothetical protein
VLLDVPFGNHSSNQSTPIKLSIISKAVECIPPPQTGGGLSFFSFFSPNFVMQKIWKFFPKTGKMDIIYTR